MAIIVAGTASGIEVVGEGGTGHLRGESCTALAAEGIHLWAILDETSVFRGLVGGSWEGVTEIPSRARCLLAHGNGPYVGTGEARLFRVSGGTVGPVASFDEVEGREKWYTPWGGPPDTRSMSASHGTIYVNVHVGGIVRSPDGGDSWEPTIDIDADVHQVLAHPDLPGLVLASTAWGLARSDDGGDSWSFHDEGLHASYSRAVAIAGDTILVSASTGPRGGSAALYRRPLQSDGPFERCAGGLPEWFPGNIDTHCLAASGTSVAFGTEAGEVFLSEDEGRTWGQAASGLPAVRALVLH
ncbi:MAG: WD40/YVTN/BNR-like repeat-containing protein [Actinomycetota bacterium]